MHTGQIKEKLKPAHQELAELGKYRAEYQRKAPGKWEVEYQRIGDKTVETRTAAQGSLETELKNRGIRNASRLVRKYAVARIRNAIENYDDRRAHGQDVGHGWLAEAIIKGDFGFRKGYRSRLEVATERVAEIRTIVAEEGDKLAAQQQHEESKTAFLKRWTSIDPNRDANWKRRPLNEPDEAATSSL